MGKRRQHIGTLPGRKCFQLSTAKANLLLLQTLVSLNPHSQPSLIMYSLSGVWFSNIFACWTYYSDEQGLLDKVNMQLSESLL